MKHFYTTLIFVLASAFAFSQSVGDYRSNGNVDFSTKTNWQVLTALPATWTNATVAPYLALLSNNNTITVQSAHTLNFGTNVTFTSNTNFTVLLQGSFNGGSSAINYGTGSPVIRIEKSGATNLSNYFQNQAIKNLQLKGTGASNSFYFNNSLKVTNTLTIDNADLTVDKFNLNNTTLEITTNGNITIKEDQTFSTASLSMTLNGNNKKVTFKGTFNLQGSPGSTLTANFIGTSGVFELQKNAFYSASNMNINFADGTSSSDAGTLNVNAELTVNNGSNINMTGDYAKLNSNGNNLSISGSSSTTTSSISLQSDNQYIDVNNNTISLSGYGYIKLLASNGLMDLVDGVNINGAGTMNYFQLSNTSTVRNSVKNNSSFKFPIGTANYYLPITVSAQPGSGNANFTVGVFQNATIDAVPTSAGASKPPIVDAIWLITPSSNKDAILKFEWDTNLEGSIFAGITNNSQVGVTRTMVGANSWTAAAAGTANIYQNSFQTNTVSLTSGSAANAFAVGRINTILPVITRNFTAVNINEQVKLNWTAVATSIHSVFEVERSSIANGKFEKISSINAIKTGEANYEFADVHPLNGESYYRVKIIDENGVINYTKTIRITLNTSQLTIDNLYPSVGNGMVNLLISSSRSAQIQLTVIDLSGRTASTQTIAVTNGSKTYSVDMTKLSAGQYFLILNNNQQVKTSRFIKQ